MRKFNVLLTGNGGTHPLPVTSDLSPRDVLVSAKRAFIAAASFSGAINILALSGSLFMLQVYDRVLPSHSLPTLVALIVLVLVLFSFSGLLESTRARLFARLGRHIDLRLRDSVFALNIRSSLPGGAMAGQAPFKDLEQLRAFFATGGPAAIFDLPWMPLYAILLFMLHPLLGCLGLFGIAALSLLTVLTDRATMPEQKSSQALTNEASALADSVRLSAETITPLGMASAMRALWSEKNQSAGEAVIVASDTASGYSSLSRFLRTALQSLSLALGAYLVVTGKATGGVMIAGSILLGKALAPVELAIAHWRGFVAARQAYDRLDKSFKAKAAEPKISLPFPHKSLRVESLHLGIPGDSKPVLSNLNFAIEAGDALGVIGPSGAGKSTLARALVGVWPMMRGDVRLDGSTLDQWSEDDRGEFTGYMPQTVDLFAGTIGQNIARFQANAPSDAVLRAAMMAGVDQLVRSMPDGFDTDVGFRGSRLSAGQRQRVALARALYNDPFFVVLDEPNSALDQEGDAALVHAIAAVRNRGGVVVIIAHRPNVLQTVNKILLLGDGQQKGFGPRDEIFKRVLNPVASTPPAAGVGQ